jgi:hypothetical protein
MFGLHGNQGRLLVSYPCIGVSLTCRGIVCPLCLFCLGRLSSSGCLFGQSLSLRLGGGSLFLDSHSFKPFLFLQVGNVALCHPRGNTGEEKETSALDAADMIHQPVSIGISAMSNQSRGRLRWVRLNWTIPWPCWTTRMYSSPLWLRSCHSYIWIGWPYYIPQWQKALQMLLDWIPRLVEQIVEHSQVDNPNNESKSNHGRPAKQTSIGRCEPPHEEPKPNEKPQMSPHCCQCARSWIFGVPDAISLGNWYWLALLVVHLHWMLLLLLLMLLLMVLLLLLNRNLNGNLNRMLRHVLWPM